MQLTYCPMRISNLETFKKIYFIALGRRYYDDHNMDD